MSELTIWHNPRCSKSRATLALIEEQGADVDQRRYLDDPPSQAELTEVLDRLGIEPWELARMGEPVARDLQLSTMDREGNRDEWIVVMAANPKLIERPIVLTADGRAMIGRPPEQVLDLL